MNFRYYFLSLIIAYAGLFVLSLFMGSLAVALLGVGGMFFFAYKWLETFEDDY